MLKKESHHLLNLIRKKLSFCQKTRDTKSCKSLKAVPFVMTYHPKLYSMDKIILEYLDLL